MNPKSWQIWRRLGLWHLRRRFAHLHRDPRARLAWHLEAIDEYENDPTLLDFMTPEGIAKAITLHRAAADEIQRSLRKCPPNLPGSRSLNR